MFMFSIHMMEFITNERADVLAKAALDKTKQFYYIP